MAELVGTSPQEMANMVGPLPARLRPRQTPPPRRRPPSNWKRVRVGLAPEIIARVDALTKTTGPSIEQIHRSDIIRLALPLGLDRLERRRTRGQQIGGRR